MQIKLLDSTQLTRCVHIVGNNFSKYMSQLRYLFWENVRYSNYFSWDRLFNSAEFSKRKTFIDYKSNAFYL